MKSSYLMDIGMWMLFCLAGVWLPSKPALAVDQPFNKVTREIWFCSSGPDRETVDIDVTVQATGLWGPLPSEDPNRIRLDKLKSSREASGHFEDDGPFIYISSYQVPGKR